MRRFVFAPRWIVGHALVVAAVVCCVLLGRWQLGRAEITHSLQNMAYALQWPLFAVFFAVMWLRMLRLESRRLDEEADAEQSLHEASAAPASPASSPAEPATSASSPTEPASPASSPTEPATSASSPAGPATTAAHPVTSSTEQVTSWAAPVTGPGEPVADDEDDPELAAYNRMLAELAARDRAESTRRR